MKFNPTPLEIAVRLVQGPTASSPGMSLLYPTSYGAIGRCNVLNAIIHDYYRAAA